MIELGGGYAARCVDAFTALGRENPMPSLFVLVEAEPTHFQWARRHMAANGMDPDAQWLINALVGVDEGPRLFMVGEGFYGNAAVSPEEIDQVVRNMASPEETATVLRNLLRGGRCGLDISYHTDIGIQFFDYGFVNTVALPDILTPLDRVDLIDIDIQGAEAEVIPAAMAELDRKVGRVQLASHGGAIHRGMWDLFFEHEWDCEVDFTPSSRHQTEWGSFDTEDGILHFVNPRLEG